MEQEQEEQSNSVTNDPSMSEIDKDYISKLPDDILARILSIHPLDSGSKAVAIFTGLLNRPCIIHGGPTLNFQVFENAIGDFLVNFDENNPLKNPRKLEFHFDKDLIVTASIGLNKKLKIDFSKGNQEFPRQFGWEIVLNTMDFAQVTPYPFSIKTLELTSVNYRSCEIISSLITKFRYVGSLIIEKCNGLRSLRVNGVAKLMKLTILDCVDLKSVFVKALELKSLHYRGFLGWFSLNNIMYLKDVKLDFKGLGFNHLNHVLYNPLLRAIRDVKVLTLHGWMYKDVFGPLLFSKEYEQHFKFSRLEHLWWIDSCMEDDNIDSLFRFLSFCTSLKWLFITIDPLSYSKPCCSDHPSSGKVKKGRLRNLKVVKLEGFENKVDIMLLKERLMEVFVTEPVIVDVRQAMHAQSLIRIPKRKAVGKATGLNKLKFSYKFVEEVEYLCTKHPHMP